MLEIVSRFALLKKLSIDIDFSKPSGVVWICDFVLNRCVYCVY